MAYGDDGAMPPTGGFGAARAVHLAGALASVALVIGGIVWGYQLAVRDVHGIPVVRALEGPMRVAPAAPGGEVTEHQGLAVNQVAAHGMAAPLPDTVTLAPRPVELTDEDVAGLIGPTLPEVVTSAEPAAPVAAPVAPAEAATAAAIAAALAEATAEDPALTEPAVAPDGSLPARAMARPLPRPPLPEPLPSDPAAPTAAPTAASAPAEVDPANVAPGTILIQLDAFDSAEDARAGWATIAGRFPAEFADKALLLDESLSGGVPFWRLRATGFDSVEAARAFCETLRTGGATCIPVAHE